MRIFVTGGAGFIGSAVVRAAIADGHEVLTFDKLTYAANLANLAEVEGNPRHRFVKGDICDGAEVSALLDAFRPDALLHLAAESHVDRSIDGPADFIETNIVGTYRLLEATRRYVHASPPALKERFRFHHVSTDEVFGSLGAEGLFTEESRYMPNSPYSASKAASDHLVRAWHHTYDLPVVMSNCSNNYGPFQFPEKLIPVVIISALEGRAIPVYGRGQNIRDWLFVDDHARALLTILSRGRIGHSYNVGGANEARNLDLVVMICRILDRLYPDKSGPYERLVTFVQDRPGHDARYAIDAGKIASELGWKPSVSLEEGLKRTVSWYLSRKDWWQPLRHRARTDQRLGLARAP